jgi:ABC-2 type transport system ATP-binding protein
VIETLKLFASFHTDPLSPETVLEMIGLNEKRNTLVKQLSGGQRQRLLIGVALVASPQLLFLDEPTSSLDPQARRQLWEVVQSQRDMKRTVILSTHYMDEAEFLCDRVAIVDRGLILALDSPQNLVNAHFPERIIVCESSAFIDPVKLRCLPSVRDVSITPKGPTYQIRLYTSEAETSLRRVLSDPGFISVRDLRVEHATLEDVFLRLTGRSISDSSTSKKHFRKSV